MSSFSQTTVAATPSPSLLAMADEMQHEQILYFNDDETGLKGFIGVHNTVLGPSLGGCRIWNYSSVDAAFLDVLRLSRGMTFKSSISGINLGGGKAVILNNNPAQRTEKFWKKFAEYVESLGGKYITAEDVGTSTKEIAYMMPVTKHLSGKPVEQGGGGDPSPFTAYGVYLGLKAAVKKAFGNEKVEGKRVVVQGVGHVGYYLAEHLVKEGAKVFVTDLNEAAVQKAVQQLGVSAISLNEVYTLDCDVYAPCALGATLNESTIPQLKCAVVAGAANNQLANENADGKRLLEKGIVYAPDFLINAGGVINCYQEVIGYNRQKAQEKVEGIYDQTLNILQLSDTEKISSHEAAVKIAMERIKKAKAK
ncbi:MAG: Glu/Leu/Phe/Val dehydrogenase [Chitinophagales bacterium]|nr:Glu/Leu/Phe/Val dehydrogenase [Chitinophagales bacterium]